MVLSRPAFIHFFCSGSSKVGRDSASRPGPGGYRLLDSGQGETWRYHILRFFARTVRQSESSVTAHNDKPWYKPRGWDPESRFSSRRAGDRFQTRESVRRPALQRCYQTASLKWRRINRSFVINLAPRENAWATMSRSNGSRVHFCCKAPMETCPNGKSQMDKASNSWSSAKIVCARALIRPVSCSKASSSNNIGEISSASVSISRRALLVKRVCSPA